MDFTTIGGLILGFGAMILAIIVEGKGDVTELTPFFVNPSAWVIIIGGTFGATLLSSRGKDMGRIVKIIGGLFKSRKYDHMGMIGTITSFAEKARREGLLALEKDIQNIDNHMLSKALQLVVDGTEPEIVYAILQTQIMQQKNQMNNDAGLFETLGGFSPTMGIIGTVMGLVGALKRMSTAGMEDTIKALAVAFIATFWGIGLANLLFLPISAKIKARQKDEILMSQIIGEGILGVRAGNHPRVVEARLVSFLTEEKKVAEPKQE